MSTVSIPRPEYPRPQFVRDSWMNLNGTWEFAIDHGDTGAERGMYCENAQYPLSILVPFCPESRLSGVENKDFMAAVWYRRTVTLTEAQCAGRVFIHFGAVDYRCTVYVNGEKADTHVGGYSSFAMEITGLVKPGDNTLVIQAQDNSRSGRQPVGKQSRLYFSHGCDYTRTTGIWQTVWLEFTPKTYLKSVRMNPDDLNGRSASPQKSAAAPGMSPSGPSSQKTAAPWAKPLPVLPPALPLSPPPCLKQSCGSPAHRCCMMLFSPRSGMALLSILCRAISASAGLKSGAISS